MLQDVLGVLVIADMRAMQCLDHFPIHAARNDAAVAPQLLPLRRRAPDGRHFAPLLTELRDVEIGQIVCDLVRRAIFDRNVVLGGHDCAAWRHRECCSPRSHRWQPP